MADIEFYKRHFGIRSVEEFLDFFFRYPKSTNRTAGFFVDWTKILTKINNPRYMEALALLGTIRHRPNPLDALEEMLLTYPRVGEVVADMLAIHEPHATVILDLDGRLEEISVIFQSSAFTQEDAKSLALFAKQSGLLEHLAKIINMWDYSFGVEVGIDTNARKGRSGKSGEMLLHPHIVAALKGKKLQHLLNAKPGKLLSKEIEIPKDVYDRAFDALIFKDSKLIAVEVNFYNVGGTKLDSIASDYQTRARDCRQAGMTFVWVTDGQGWNSSKGMLRQAIENIDYIFNFELLERGALTKLCDEVFR